MYLSKSKYCQLWQCPKLLWLETYHPEWKTADPAGESRMAMGNVVGDLAMELFGDYTEVTKYKEDGRPDLPAMIAGTALCLQEGVENICEASFSYGGMYCAVDILHKEQEGYAIYEVKSSSQVQEIYGVDVAYQKYVLEHCGIAVTGTYLVHINSNYVRGERLEVSELFQISDISELVEKETPHIPERIAVAENTLKDSREPVRDLSERCEEPYHCGYWEYCSRFLPSPSVFDLYRLSAKKKFAYYQSGYCSFESLLANVKLNKRQLQQVTHQLEDIPAYIDQDGIRKFLQTLSYPIYFLDFETMQCVVPPFPDSKPYQQIPFQYSVHYVETPGGEILHKEFLAEAGSDPRYALAQSLCRDIPENACVVAYNKSFECGRIKELAKQFPDLSDYLMHMQSDIKDLIEPFQSGYVYNRAMGASFSIKSVLPALFPDDARLNYHHLTGVQNGKDAMDMFPKLPDMSPEEQQIARKELLAYCELDTWAMVKIWQALQEFAGD